MKCISIIRTMAIAVLVAVPFVASAQKYPNGIIDKTIAVVGNEVIMISQLEDEVQMMKAYGMMSDKSGRCEILESMMSSKLFLMQARVDSINVNNDIFCIIKVEINVEFEVDFAFDTMSFAEYAYR